MKGAGEGAGHPHASERRLRHPAPGSFTAVQWLRFAGVHRVHHGKIIRDVLPSM